MLLASNFNIPLIKSEPTLPTGSGMPDHYQMSVKLNLHQSKHDGSLLIFGRVEACLELTK